MDRGQTYTLEGVFGAVLVILAIIFALQAVSVSPQSGSLGSQQVAEDRRATAQGILEVASDEGALKEAALYWNESDEGFAYALEEGYYAGGRNTDPSDTNSPPKIALGDILEEYTGSTRANVNLYYIDEDGDRDIQRLVYQGAPSSGATSAQTSIALMDGDPLIDEDRSERSTTVEDVEDDFYAPDVSSGASGSGLYNTLTVEVTVW